MNIQCTLWHSHRILENTFKFNFIHCMTVLLESQIFINQHYNMIKFNFKNYFIFSEKVAYMPTTYHHSGLQKGVLLFSVCLFLSFLILIAIIALTWNKMKFWKREGTLSEG